MVLDLEKMKIPSNVQLRGGTARNFLMTDEAHDRLRAAADATGQTMSFILDALIMDGLPAMDAPK